MGETDLISRQAAIDAITAILGDPTARRNGWIDPYYAIQKIKQLPSAQPEIVRCKDCKWYELPSHKITENCVRWMKSNGILLPIKPSDYCGYAERKEDASNR